MRIRETLANLSNWLGAMQRRSRPVCVGTGLITLDIVISKGLEMHPRLSAGGSCGNVLIILSYLGWRTYPIARLSRDAAAYELLEDMRAWAVNTSLVYTSKSGSTPIIVERIGQTVMGTPRHRYEFVCPYCGSYLPRFRPIPDQDVVGIAQKMPKAQVFFFDRVSRASLRLAAESKRQGALVMFEPSSISDKKLFLEGLQIADIVKYSHERLHSIQQFTDRACPYLEIETMGSEGLRYRIGGNRWPTYWKRMGAYPIENARDSAGAGDWCSAGIIHTLGGLGTVGLTFLDEQSVESGIKFGQALAALSCLYEGPRGNMYNLSRRQFEGRLSEIAGHDSQFHLNHLTKKKSVPKLDSYVCPRCLLGHGTPS